MSAPNPLPKWYFAWEKWIEGGKKTLRPKSAPKRIPAWAWDKYKERHQPAPSPPAGVSHALAQNVMFCAQEPLTALRIPGKYKIALSADPAYASWVADAVREFRKQNRTIYTWCDCRTTLPAEAISLATKYDLDGWIGQAESSDEFNVAIAANAQIIIGNVSSLPDYQRQIVAENKVAFIQEDYWNTMPWSQPDWMNLPIAASCIGVYDASSENPNGRYVSIADYHAAGRFPPGSGIYYNAGLTEADYLTLAKLA